MVDQDDPAERSAREQEDELLVEDVADDGEVEILSIGDDDEADDLTVGGSAGTTAAELERELATVKERWLRAVADFDNFRKRTERERRDERRYAHLEPLRALLPVLDNLERASAADGSLEDLRQGVELILQQLRDLLERHGVESVPAAGEPFDPSVHDAVSRHESDEVAVPTVAEELQRGYRMQERLLRPAMVTVAMPAGETEKSG